MKRTFQYAGISGEREAGRDALKLNDCSRNEGASIQPLGVPLPKETIWLTPTKPALSPFPVLSPARRSSPHTSRSSMGAQSSTPAIDNAKDQAQQNITEYEKHLGLLAAQIEANAKEVSELQANGQVDEAKAKAELGKTLLKHKEQVETIAANEKKKLEMLANITMPTEGDEAPAPTAAAS